VGIACADVTLYSKRPKQIEEHQKWRLWMASRIDSTLPHRKMRAGLVSFKYLKESFGNSHRVEYLVENSTTTRNYFGDFVLVNQRFQNNYGHVFHDHLPQLSWVIQNTDAKVILMDTKLNRIFTDCFFSNSVNRIVFSPPGAKKTVFGSLSSYELKEPRSYTQERFNIHYHSAFYKQKLTNVCKSNHSGKVIYCSRTSSRVEHGRVMDSNNENDIISLLSELFGSRLVVFNGEDKFGNAISVYEQALLFSSADIVIGPHGSAMANIGWLDWSATSPRKKVIEFVCTKISTQVQFGCPFSKTYSWLFGTLNAVDYSHISFTENSTADTTYISLSDLKLALETV
jgi:hypothetical protein